MRLQLIGNRIVLQMDLTYIYPGIFALFLFFVIESRVWFEINLPWAAGTDLLCGQNGRSQIALDKTWLAGAAPPRAANGEQLICR